MCVTKLGVRIEPCVRRWARERLETNVRSALLSTRQRCVFFEWASTGVVKTGNGGYLSVPCLSGSASWGNYFVSLLIQYRKIHRMGLEPLKRRVSSVLVARFTLRSGRRCVN